VAFIVPAMFALNTQFVIIAGGLDVSFPAIASFSMYVVTRILQNMDYTGGVFLPFVMAAMIGMCLGALNGWLIATFKLPPLIVTLGTQSLFTGILMGVLEAIEISGSSIPRGIIAFGSASLFSTKNPENGVTSYMPVTILVLVGTIAATFFILHYTMFGRAVFAIGNDENAAARAGFNVKRTKIAVYCYAGLIAGVTGIVRMCIMKFCHPTNLTGIEMQIIAAVVLGGTSIMGGKGTITGALLGTALIITMSNSLLLLGIPVEWQTFCTGMLIVVGTGVSAYQSMRESNKLVNRLAGEKLAGVLTKGGQKS